MKRTIMLATASAVLLAGCVAPTEPYLNQAKTDCASGQARACQAVPSLQAQVTSEKNEQAKEVALGLLLGVTAVAAGAAAGYSASHPTYYSAPVVVVCRPWWAC